MTPDHVSFDDAPLAPAVHWRDLEQGEHAVQFYEDDEFLLQTLTEYFGSALERGEVAIVIAAAPHRASLEERLTARGCDVEGARNRGDYVALDAAETLSSFMVDGWPDEKRFMEVVGKIIVAAAKRPSARIRAFGEMVVLLAAEGRWDAAVRLERLWNHLSRMIPFSLLCGYPVSAFSRESQGRPFLAVCGEHARILPAESYSGLPNADERLRAVARLQQMASALGSETAEKKEIERALRSRERELADFIENALEGLHQIGPDGRILWANRALLELLGYRDVEYVGHDAAEFHARPEAFQEMWRKLMERERIYDWPADLRCKDGSIKHVLIHSNGLWENGRFVHTRCFIRDITERQRLEAELNRRLEELAEVDRRKDEFLAMLAHELRNPLSPVLTAVHLMRRSGDDPARTARAREIIERQISLMSRLVDDLLDLARISRGKIELQEGTVVLSSVVERAIEIARPLIEERAHRLTVELPPESVAFLADGARLEQILSNLLHNAARYTEVGGRIDIRAWREDDMLMISVRDDGQGLTPELRAQVFDLFLQGRHKSSANNGGLGIGLTLARQLVELHGGSIEVYSEGLGYGSEFVVRLPLRFPAAASNGSNDHAAVASAPGRTQRILVVDDNRDAAAMLAELLRQSGHEVRVAYDGFLAIDDAQSFRPDVVILDIGMPEMDGYEAARRFRASPALRSCVLVALTGYAQERDRVRSQNAGFDHHLAKPVDSAKLMALIGTPR